MVGVDLNPQQPLGEADGRIGRRLHVVAAVEKPLAGGKCVLDVANLHRDDRGHAAAHDQIERPQAVGQSLDERPQLREQIVAFRRIENVANGAEWRPDRAAALGRQR